MAIVLTFRVIALIRFQSQALLGFGRVRALIDTRPSIINFPGGTIALLLHQDAVAKCAFDFSAYTHYGRALSFSQRSPHKWSSQSDRWRAE